MRCRMRCGDIWRCGGPIKKYVPVESIGIEGRTQEMTFDSQVPPYSVTYSINISPSDATKKDVRIESNNPSVISVDSIESGQVTFTIHSEGEARVRITSLADADISDEYGVTITAPSQQFSPNNGIFVDVDTEGTATGRKRRTKATAMGDRFTAKVFILKEESEDYVLLEWVRGGDVSKTYVGAANEDHTRAMFTEEATDKLAREIEALWDDGQIANGFVKFTDETWGVVEQFYSTPLTSESIEELQETLASDEIVTLPETYFDGIEVRCENQPDISGGAGSSKKIGWRGTPDTPGTHDPIIFEIGDESIVSITDIQIHPEDEQYSEYYTGTINFLEEGETTITFYSVNNPRGTLTEAPAITTPPESYHYINLHQDEFPGNVEVGQTTICQAEVEDYRVDDTLVASNYDGSIVQIAFNKKSTNHNGWRSDWDINITGLQAGETTARIHSVNNPNIYEDLLITVSEPIPSCPASIQAVWGNDVTIEVGQTTAVITNFTTTAECENVDYSNIVAYVRASYNVPSDVATASIDFNENKVYVTGVKAGECTVVFTDGDRSWSNNVTVTEPTPPAYATISSGSENVTMAPGDNVVKWITYSPSDANTSNITWTDSDGNVAHGSYQHLGDGECHTLIDAYGEGTCTVTVSDGTNSYVYNVTVAEQSYTMTINIENLPEGANISGEITDAETGETLEEISVSSFPMTIELLPSGAIDLNCSSFEGVGDVRIGSYGEGGGNNYQININCEGYKSLFETVGFSLDDMGDGNYSGHIETAELDSNVSMTIGFMEEPHELMFTCNSREFGSLIGPDGETWDWDTPYTFEPGTQVTYNGETLTIGEDVFSFSSVFYSLPTSIDIDGNMMETDVPYELSSTEGIINIEFYFAPIGGNDFDFVDDGEGYYVGSSEFDFNGPRSFVERYAVENSDSGAEIGNAIVTITGDGFPYHIEVKVPTGDVNPGNRVRIVRRTEEEGYDLGEIAGDIPEATGGGTSITLESNGVDVYTYPAGELVSTPYTIDAEITRYTVASGFLQINKSDGPVIFTAGEQEGYVFINNRWQKDGVIIPDGNYTVDGNITLTAVPGS